MRKPLVALGVALSVAGCDLGVDLTGLGDAFSCTDCWELGGSGPGGGGGRPSGRYSGDIWIGPYSVAEGEATVYAYDPTNLSVPIDSAVSRDQGCVRLVTTSCTSGYAFDFSRTPRSAVCGYHARLVLWNGDSSELAPLFPYAPTPCDSLSNPGRARSYQLPAYPPLDTPFVLEGSISIDGEPAGEGIRVDVLTRPTSADSVPALGPDCDAWSFFSVRQDQSVPPPRAVCVSVHTDASGAFAYSTVDAAQLFTLCNLAVARVSLPDGRTLQRQLESATLATCAARRFHDFRFGGQEVARGAVRLLGADRWAAAGEVYVEILDASHTRTIGDPAWTLDDGSFFLWFPDDMGEPPCGLVLRATVVGGASQIKARSGGTASTCPGTALRLFEIPAGGP